MHIDQHADQGGQREAVKENVTEDRAFVPVPVRRGARDDDALRVHHFAHHAPGAVGRGHEHGADAGAVGGNGLQTAEEDVRGRIRAGQGDPEPTEERSEKWIEGAGLSQREAQSGIGGSLEALVIDDEILNYAFYASSPRPWDAAALDVDAIVDGVESSFGFLATAHTRTYLRSDFVRPSLSYRGGLGDWMASGRTGLVDLATEKAAAYVAREPVGLPADIGEELCRLIDEAARSIGLAAWPDPRRLFEG